LNAQASLASNFSLLRYTLSIIAILICLILPWTVEWAPKSDNMNKTMFHHFKTNIGYPNTETTTSSISKTVIYNQNLFDSSSKLNFKNERQIIRNDFYIYIGGTGQRHHSKMKRNTTNLNNETIKPNNSINDNINDLEYYYYAPNDYKIKRSIIDANKDGLKTTTSNIETDLLPNLSLTYYYFELHVLLFHIAILSCSTFIQLYFYFKLSMMIIAIMIYAIGFNIHNIYECLNEIMHFNLPFLKLEIMVQIIFFVLFLHLIDRRVFLNIFIKILSTEFNQNIYKGRSKF
jgi:hypothetical protein